MKDIVCIIDMVLAIVAIACLIANLLTLNFGAAWLWVIPVVILLFNILSLMKEEE